MIYEYKDLEALSEAAAERIQNISQEAVTQRGSCSIALAGGNTPKKLYETLATKYASALPWEKIQLFWGDERYVPQDDSNSNYLLVRQSLLDHISIPAGNIHPIPTNFADPELSAEAYASTMRNVFGTNDITFDIMLLGLGGDGHTASLFPTTAINEDDPKLARVTASPIAPKTRISMTLPVIVHARNLMFLVSGSEKKEIFAKVTNDDTAKDYPAGRVGMLAKADWYIDEAVTG